VNKKFGLIFAHQKRWSWVRIPSSTQTEKAAPKGRPCFFRSNQSLLCIANEKTRTILLQAMQLFLFVVTSRGSLFERSENGNPIFHPTNKNKRRQLSEIMIVAFPVFLTIHFF
jgi:hypothetical protein